MGMGFFDDSTPGWKTAVGDTEPAVPVVPAPNALTLDNNVSAPAAAPAAPALTPDQQRIKAAIDAHSAFVQNKPTDPADARILASTPYVNPVKGQNALALPMVAAGIEQSQTVGSTKLSPEAKAAAARAEAESIKAADAKRAEGALVSQNATQLSNEQIAQASQLQDKAKQDLDKLTAIQKRVDDTMGQQQKDTDAYLKAVGSIDPNRMMKGGRGVMASIAAGLGAFGSGLTGAPNSALQMIENAIQRDYQAQKDQADSKRYKSEATGRLVSQLRQSLSDEQSVQLAHNAATKEALAMKLGGMATRFKGTEAEAGANTMAASLQASAAQARAELLAREQVHAQTSVSTKIVPLASVLPQPTDSLTALQDQTKKERDIAENRGELPVSADHDEAVKVKAEVANDLKQLRPLMEYRDMLKGSVGAGLDMNVSMNASKRGQLKRLVKETLGRMQSGGAITDDENKNFEAIIFGSKLDLSSEALDDLTRRYADWTINNATTRVEMLHPRLIDRTWESVRRGIGDDSLYRQIRNRKLDDADSAASRDGVTFRNGFNDRARDRPANR